MAKAPITTALHADLEAMAAAGGHESMAELIRRYLYLGLADDARTRQQLHDVVKDPVVIGYRDGRAKTFCAGPFQCRARAVAPEPKDDDQ